jgi:hypothetical protein
MPPSPRRCSNRNPRLGSPCAAQCFRTARRPLPFGANEGAEDVYFETVAGGAVLSTGSITFCGSLSRNNYDNKISRLLENVLRRFAQ